jgi:hypothetical protein
MYISAAVLKRLSLGRSEKKASINWQSFLVFFFLRLLSESSESNFVSYVQGVETDTCGSCVGGAEEKPK